MADLFYTLLIIWVLWRIFGGSVRTNTQFSKGPQHSQRKEGDVTITSAPKPNQQKGNEGGEYVDYEEIK